MLSVIIISMFTAFTFVIIPLNSCLSCWKSETNQGALREKVLLLFLAGKSYQK